MFEQYLKIPNRSLQFQLIKQKFFNESQLITSVDISLQFFNYVLPLLITCDCFIRKSTMIFRRIRNPRQVILVPQLQDLTYEKPSKGDNYRKFHFSGQRYSPQHKQKILNTRNTMVMTSRPSRRHNRSEQKPMQAQQLNKTKHFVRNQLFSLSKRPFSRDQKNIQESTFNYNQSSQLQKFSNQKFGMKKSYFQLNSQPTTSNFSKLLAIGKGGYGRVWKVVQLDSRRIYAMKVMRKAKIVKNKSVFSVMNERQLLAQLKNPFLVNMKYAFQDSENLYMILDYCPRGDLRFHLAQMGRFQQHHIRFFLACIVLCLEYLHSMEIIHRDIKPENLVLDKRGYVRVTDFGISRPIIIQNGKDTSGTPGYMAPEVLLRRNHSYSVDFYSLGVIAFEFMTGKRPYLGSSREEVRQKIVARQVKLINPPQGWSQDGLDLINRLIQRTPEDRLGFNGVAQIKNHSFFKPLDWQLLSKKQLTSPFIPKTIEEDYIAYRRGIPEETLLDDSNNDELKWQDQSKTNSFVGYEYYGNLTALRKMTLERQSRAGKKIHSMMRQR